MSANAETLERQAAKLIPELWSLSLNKKLDKSGVGMKIVNKIYEKDIKNYGDTVHIGEIGDVTISDYSEDATDGGVTYQRVDATSQDLKIDQSKSFGIFLSDTYVALLGFLALTLALGAYAGVVDRLFSLLKLLIPLALIMLMLQLAFMRDGNVVWGFITDTGLITGSKACLRLLGVALPLILMLMVTKLNDLANACVEVLHVPYRYAFTFTTALRFVPVFGQEMNAIMEAQTARGVEYDTKNPIKKLKLMLPLCVPLLISSVGKTDATALAAEQRGFYLRTRASSYKRYPIKGLDIAVLIVSIALIAIGFLF